MLAAATSPRGAPRRWPAPAPTGATMTAALFALRRLHGVRRPALAVQLPCPAATARRRCCSTWAPTPTPGPVDLVQFAYLGAAFSEAVLGVAEPRVALLSVGEEAKKGSAEVVEAHAQARRGAAGTRLPGKPRGRRPARRGGRRDRHRRVHRQRRPEDDRGHGAGPSPRRCAPRPARGQGSRGRASASPVAGRPAPPAGPRHDGRRDPARACEALPWSDTAARGRRASPTRCGSRRARSRSGRRANQQSSWRDPG